MVVGCLVAFNVMISSPPSSPARVCAPPAFVRSIACIRRRTTRARAPARLGDVFSNHGMPYHPLTHPSVCCQFQLLTPQKTLLLLLLLLVVFSCLLHTAACPPPISLPLPTYAALLVVSAYECPACHRMARADLAQHRPGLHVRHGPVPLVHHHRRTAPLLFCCGQLHPLFRGLPGALPPHGRYMCLR